MPRSSQLGWLFLSILACKTLMATNANIATVAQCSQQPLLTHTLAIGQSPAAKLISLKASARVRLA